MESDTKMSKLKRIFKLSFYRFNYSAYKKMLSSDEKFNASFRHPGSENPKLTWSDRHAVEYKTVKIYRKYQVNHGNLWGYIYKWKLERWAIKYGIEFLGNPNIGRGMIIGHWGRIVINGNAKFGDEVMLTHGVTIGRDLRGKRAGSPTFGNRVCIRTNSTVTGNVVIGDDVLIAPNTFVNFDVPSHSVVIGNPASIHHKDNATEGHLGRIENE